MVESLPTITDRLGSTMAFEPRPSIREGYLQLRTAQKSSRGAPLYSVAINRPLGRLLAAVAHHFGMTPDQVTMVSGLFTFTGIAAIAVLPPVWGTGLFVSLALVLGYALDAADGQLARLRGGGTLTGEWLDHVLDSFKNATLHLAVLVMMYRHFEVSEVWLVVPIAFAAVTVVHFFGMLLTELLTRTAYLRAGVQPVRTRSGSVVMSVMKLPTDYGLLCLVFLLLGAHLVFQWVYLALAVATAVYTALVTRVWHRRLRKLDLTMGA